MSAESTGELPEYACGITCFQSRHQDQRFSSVVQARQRPLVHSREKGEEGCVSRGSSSQGEAVPARSNGARARRVLGLDDRRDSVATAISQGRSTARSNDSLGRQQQRPCVPSRAECGARRLRALRAASRNGENSRRQGAEEEAKISIFWRLPWLPLVSVQHSPCFLPAYKDGGFTQASQRD